MNTRKIMLAVVKALRRITGSSGSPNDAQAISEFENDPQGSSLDVFFSVAGIPMSHFFAMSDQGFGGMRDSLWQEILDRVEDADLDDEVDASDVAQPSNWDVDTDISQIVVYLHAKLT